MSEMQQYTEPQTGELTAEIHIDISSIPAFRCEELARGAIELMERVFSLPGAEERYQAWLAERKKKKAATAAR